MGLLLGTNEKVQLLIKDINFLGLCSKSNTINEIRITCNTFNESSHSKGEIDSGQAIELIKTNGMSIEDATRGAVL